MQQQQHADYDLLAVFNSEAKAGEAAAKLQKEGFSQDEVFQLPAGLVGSGEFRQHGPSSERSSYFLQTQRKGPSVGTIISYAVIFGVVLALVLFLAQFVFKGLPEPLATIIGGVVGIIVGFILGMTRQGRVIGAIGQDVPAKAPPVRPTQSGNTVVAIRLADSDNTIRRSKARAILINNEGKIDRSVGRRE